MKTTEDVMGALRDPKNWQDHSPPKGHDKHLSDSERAHSGQPGAKVKHGADANNQVVRRSPIGFKTQSMQVYRDQLKDK